MKSNAAKLRMAEAMRRRTRLLRIAAVSLVFPYIVGERLYRWLAHHANYSAVLEDAARASSTVATEACSLGIKGVDDPITVDKELAKMLYLRARDSYGLSY